MLGLLILLGAGWTARGHAADCPELLRHSFPSLQTGEPQNLWHEYEAVRTACDNFAMQRIEGLPDIYPVFRELFKKKLA